MNAMSTEELRALIESGEPFALIMTMSENAYAMGHIPGSSHASHVRDLAGIRKDDAPIVLYCTGQDCAASGIAYRQMRAAGYRNVRHYVGGLAAWEAAGLEIARGRVETEGTNDENGS